MNLYEKHPKLDNSVFVAPNATVVGNVSMAFKSNVWYGAVVRGESLQPLPLVLLTGACRGSLPR
jgi:carbonic anhydrase/acetyltransferase-like protein (isoleucine patch superfamily)